MIFHNFYEERLSELEELRLRGDLIEAFKVRSGQLLFRTLSSLYAQFGMYTYRQSQSPYNFFYLAVAVV